jgi:hypothetical protein
MPTEDQRQRGKPAAEQRLVLPDDTDTDGVIELSLRLAKAARRRLPRRIRDDED